MDKPLTVSLVRSRYLDSSNGKCLKTAGGDGRSFLSPVLHGVGMKSKGECVRIGECLLGVGSCTQRSPENTPGGSFSLQPGTCSSAAAGQGNAAAVHCCFGSQKHARRTVLAFAVRLLAGVAGKAVKAAADHGGRFCWHRGWWQRGGRAGHGACTMVAGVESARHSFPRNDTDQASPFAVTWLITPY